MKRKLTVALATLAMSFTLVACGQSNDTATNSNAKVASNANSASNVAVTENATSNVEDFQAQTDDKTLVVGLDSIGGDFIGGFTNTVNDNYVRYMLGTYGFSGYNTVYQDKDGEYKFNMNILTEEPEIKENDDKSKTYTFKLNPDMKWSDGEPITSKDYIFGSILVTDSKYIPITGSSDIGSESIKGYEAFHKGETNVLQGIKYIDDNTFSFTIDSSFLPYYYEITLAGWGPTPMHALAPNMDLTPEGNGLVAKEGYKLSDDDKASLTKLLDSRLDDVKKELEEAKASEDFASSDQKEYDTQIADIEKQKADVESGNADATDILYQEAALKYTQDYRLKPQPTAGQYKFVSYENNMVKLELDENFLGNQDGKKATIPNVIFQRINPAIATDLIENGDIDVYEQEMDGAKIEKMTQKADKGKLQTYTFNRNGYGKLVFITDRSATQYKEVRQAVAFLLDRDSFVQDFAGGYATVTDGEYGLSQWMYEERGADIEGKLVHYTLNLDEANKRLDESPYKFEKDGKTPWNYDKAQELYNKDSKGFDYYRYNDKGEKLQVNQQGSPDSEITTLINNQLPENAKQVGMEYNVKAVDFSTMMQNLYFPKDDAEYTAFNMGSTFGDPYDPWGQYNTKGNDNTTKTNDPAEDELTEKFRHVDPSDKEKYLDYWEEHQLWFNDYLPEIPLYSNIIYSETSNRVEGFETSPYWGVDDAIFTMTLK
ncbi:MAG: ABC transporter substrate-binding protein [Peptoniphilaceae bacterium]|nr:ABC transporter substrate-binding protein [Peptoniphilaceae bacterium]MDY3738561.1 ABC transporter substrate-binding protein [Peptoniphilaceae bacterium]